MTKKISSLWMLMLLAASAFAQDGATVSLLKQRNMSRWGIPGGNYSGISRIGGSRYAVVSDKGNEGFYIFDITIDSIYGKIMNVSILAQPSEKSDSGLAPDQEDVAYVPASGTVFVADEGQQRIIEYGLDGNRTGREPKIPFYLQADSIYPNYGFESLTYSVSDGLLWTITEQSLKNDGKISDSTNKEGCRLRLQSFDAVTGQPVAWYYYKTDAPTARKAGRNYSFGVSAITAMEDGTLLVMEREFYVSKNYLGSWVKINIYKVDIAKRTAEGCLDKQLVVSFKNRLNALRRNIANYEGMCLGPNLADGRQTIILISDSQNNHGNALFRLKDQIRVIILN